VQIYPLIQSHLPIVTFSNPKVRKNPLSDIASAQLKKVIKGNVPRKGMTAGVAPTAGSNSEPRKFHESTDINEESYNHPYYAQEGSLQEKLYQVIAQGKMQQ
jgi:hypothetical protein